MTLSMGNKLRKVQEDGETPVPNEGHSLFEVTGYGSITERDEEGKLVQTQVAKLKPLN